MGESDEIKNNKKKKKTREPYFLSLPRGVASAMIGSSSTEVRENK